MSCTLTPHAGEEGRCDRCGTALKGRQKRWCTKACSDAVTREHHWSWARSVARRRDRFKCVTCGSPDNLEVNHIAPREGAGYGWGCHNHLANLETLCHTCHVRVTNAQRAERKARREEAA